MLVAVLAALLLSPAANAQVDAGELDMGAVEEQVAAELTALADETVAAEPEPMEAPPELPVEPPQTGSDLAFAHPPDTEVPSEVPSEPHVATEPPAYVDDSPVSPERPADEPPEPPEPAAVPINLNIDVRILSPGDDGDVVQTIGGAPGTGVEVGAVPDALDWTWNWDWTWDCGSGAPATAASIDWDWNWNWGPGCLEAVQEMLDEFERGDDIREALEMPVAVDLPFRAPGVLADSLGTAPAPPDGRPTDPNRQRSSLTGPAVEVISPLGAAPVLPAALIVAAPEPASALAAVPDPHSAPKPEDGPDGPMPIVVHAAGPAFGSGGGGGGAGAVLLAALLGALTLARPRRGARVGPAARKLSSQLSSSRLERPG